MCYTAGGTTCIKQTDNNREKGFFRLLLCRLRTSIPARCCTRTAFSGILLARGACNGFFFSPYILRGERSLRFCDAAEATKHPRDPTSEPAAPRIAWLASPPTPCLVRRRRRRSCFFEDLRWTQRCACWASKATPLRGLTREALEEGLAGPILPSCYTRTRGATSRDRSAERLW